VSAAPSLPIPARSPGRFTAAAEALLPIGVLQAYVWLVPHERPRWMDVACGVVLIAMVAALVVRGGPRTLRGVGLAWGRDHLRALPALVIFTAAATAGVIALAWLSGRLYVSHNLPRALLGYPLWGLLQQGLLLGVIYPRVRAAMGDRSRDHGHAPPSPAGGPLRRVEYLAALATGLLFGLVHAPNPLLMAGASGMAFFYALVWSRAPSLPLVALSHGIIGAVCDKMVDTSMRIGGHYFAL
jgi:hypothetical protein